MDIKLVEEAIKQIENVLQYDGISRVLLPQAVVCAHYRCIWYLESFLK